MDQFTAFLKNRHRVALLLIAVLCIINNCLMRGIEGCSGEYSRSCNNVQIVGTDLRASCGDGQGGYATSSLNLDDHITNNNGNLQCSSGGAFSATCQSIGLIGSNELSAQCFAVAGNLVQTSVNLDHCVANIFGQLTWACV